MDIDACWEAMNLRYVWPVLPLAPVWDPRFRGGLGYESRVEIKGLCHVALIPLMWLVVDQNGLQVFLWSWLPPILYSLFFQGLSQPYHSHMHLIDTKENQREDLGLRSASSQRFQFDAKQVRRPGGGKRQWLCCERCWEAKGVPGLTVFVASCGQH